MSMKFPSLLVFALVASGLPVAAQTPIPSKDEQVMVAVLPLPENLRAGARVIGYDAAGKFVELRAGSGMVCPSTLMAIRVSAGRSAWAKVAV